jgi:hypothetical protein
MHNVIHITDNVMYTYNLLDCHFNEEGLMNTAGTIRGLLCAQGTYILHRPRRIILIERFMVYGIVHKSLSDLRFLFYVSEFRAGSDKIQRPEAQTTLDL